MFFSPKCFPSTVENNGNKQECDVGATKASCSSSNEEATEFKDGKAKSFQDSCNDDDLCEDDALECADECKDTDKSKVKQSIAYPEPRLPFPCTSSLSSKEQKTYLGFLMSRKNMDPPQVPAFYH